MQEVIASDFTIDMLLTTEDFRKENARLIDSQRVPVEIVSVSELERVTTLESNNAAVAVVKTKENRPLVAGPDEFVLVLDDIRDPGNLGTILRIADWYGIRKLICSETTAEVYNPKVISASKGSFTRVSWWYGNLARFFTEVNPQVFRFTGPFWTAGTYMLCHSVKAVIWSWETNRTVSDRISVRLLPKKLRFRASEMPNR